MPADHRVNAIGANQHFAAHRLAGRAVARIDEMRSDAALVLKKARELQPGADRIRTELPDDGVVDDFLQTAAMNGELRIVEARIEAAFLLPNLLPEAVDVDELLGADRGRVERRQETERGELLDRMRQRVDADADFADFVRLLEDRRLDAAPVQHEREREPANPAACNQDCHAKLLLKQRQPSSPFPTSWGRWPKAGWGAACRDVPFRTCHSMARLSSNRHPPCTKLTANLPPPVPCFPHPIRPSATFPAERGRVWSLALNSPPAAAKSRPRGARRGRPLRPASAPPCCECPRTDRRAAGSASPRTCISR